MNICSSLNRGAKMKNIKVVKEKQVNSLFAIGSYSFVECDAVLSQLPIYPISIKIPVTSSVDVRFFLEEVDCDIRFLQETPVELTEYIKKYEEISVYNEVCLFHDFRTKYIDVLEYNQANTGDSNDDVIMVGFTIVQESVYLAIKAFSLSSLTKFTELIINYCTKHEIEISFKHNIRWVQLEQFMRPANKISQNETFNIFLLKTLEKKYCKIFLDTFQKIDREGYFDKTFYNQKFYQEFMMPTGKLKNEEISQISKFFSPFWKTEIEGNHKSKVILCLHDELLNNESLEKVVYTFKPFLMQYYQLHWFEDFCVHIIEHMCFLPYKLVNIYAGRQFDFFQKGEVTNVREIDIIMEVEHKGLYKIIAVECKKTLTFKEIELTNKKTKNKILKSHRNVIDAFVHIGCFNNGVDFNKKIDNTKEEYKQSIIQLQDDPQVPDVPYYAFSISSIENLEMKMQHILNDIFKEW